MTNIATPAPPEPTCPACLAQPDQTPQAGLGWPPGHRRTRDPLIETLFTLSDELAALWTATCKVDTLRAELDQADPDRPVDLGRPSDAVDAAVGGDTPALLASLQRLGPPHAYRAASMAAVDRRNAVVALRGLADTATLLTKAGKPLPAWRGVGALDQAAELLHNAGRNLAAADSAIVTALTESNPSP